MTFYTLLALFQNLSAILPGGAITVISDQITNVAAASESGLSLAAVGGFLLSLWSANGATKAMIAGIGVAYDQPDTRGFVRKTLVSLAFTLGFLAFALVAIGVMALQATIGESVSGAAGVAFRLLAWPALFAALCLGLAVLYRYGPSRERAKWRWVTWGSVIAAAAWLAASIGFSFYAANFGSYDKTYGTLGAVIGLMTWIWISGMVVLLGAELNSELEHQTARDSTTGAPEALGERGATMADTIGALQGR